MLPGSLLHRVATRYCSAATCERVIEPLIADLQREWLSADRPAQRAVARVRGYASFWQTLVLCGVQATPQMLTTWPLPMAMRTVMMAVFCAVVVFAVGWFKTGGISWRQGIREPGLVGFWMGAFWPMWSQWRRKPADTRPHLAVVMSAPILVASVLCWIYPTRMLQVVVMSLTFFFLEPLFARIMKRSQQSREILRQIDERAERLK